MVTDHLGKSWGILGKSWINLGEILGESAVDNCIIWQMCGTTSGAYCQQWIAIHGATCICDAVFSTAGALRTPLIRYPSDHPPIAFEQ